MRKGQMVQWMCQNSGLVHPVCSGTRSYRQPGFLIPACACEHTANQPSGADFRRQEGELMLAMQASLSKGSVREFRRSSLRHCSPPFLSSQKGPNAYLPTYPPIYLPA